MAAPNYQLTMRSGPTPGKIYPLDQEEVRLGRDLTSDISVSDPEVSRSHARFLMREGNVFVEDLGSTNGTFLNGARISTPQQLRSGDVLTFGETIVMVFEKDAPVPDATMVSSHVHTEQEIPESAPEYYQSPQAAEEYQSVQSYSESPASPSPQPAAKKPVKKSKGKLPTWLMIMIVAIVVMVCLIAVTMYFMPASWWCAITFDALAGCPVP